MLITYVPISILHSESAKLMEMLCWGKYPISRTFSLAISKDGRIRWIENRRRLSRGTMVAIFITWLSSTIPVTPSKIHSKHNNFPFTDIVTPMQFTKKFQRYFRKGHDEFQNWYNPNPENKEEPFQFTTNSTEEIFEVSKYLLMI